MKYFAYAALLSVALAKRTNPKAVADTEITSLGKDYLIKNSKAQ